MERAHYFANWSPSQSSEEVVCKLFITSLGYMTLMEEKVLEKGDGHNHHREGYYSWWGPHCNKKTGMNSGVEHLLFSIEDEFTEISGFYLGYGYGLSAPQNLWRYPLQLPGSKYTTTVQLTHPLFCFFHEPLLHHE